MKKFEMAEIMVEKFEIVDVITTSDEYVCPNNETEIDW